MLINDVFKKHNFLMFQTSKTKGHVRRMDNKTSKTNRQVRNIRQRDKYDI